MAYKITFKTQKGNTTVEVEDLKRSGSCTSCAKTACGDYPGVCDHCGKLHIRYLAHVKQDVADTLHRATTPDHKRPLERTDEEVAALGIALLDGKDKKQMDVGCVCVAKYLVDCGVDAGIAERLQDEVSRLTSVLQQIAGFEACKEEDRLRETLAHFHTVKALYERHNKLRTATIGKRTTPTNLWNVSHQAWSDYTTARDRLIRETHGFNVYANTIPSVEDLTAHFDFKIRRASTRLHRYQAGGATFTA